MTVQISAKDTATMIRKALKKEFAGVKFSVRTNTYAGGASIDVGWTDGPAERTVEVITDSFQGKGAVDNTDYAPYLTAQMNGQAVHFLADHVFVHRRISEPARQGLADELAEALGVEALEAGRSYPTPSLVRKTNPHFHYDQGTAGELMNALSEARAA